VLEIAAGELSEPAASRASADRFNPRWAAGADVLVVTRVASRSFGGNAAARSTANVHILARQALSPLPLQAYASAKELYVSPNWPQC